MNPSWALEDGEVVDFDVLLLEDFELGLLDLEDDDDEGAILWVVLVGNATGAICEEKNVVLRTGDDDLLSGRNQKQEVPSCTLRNTLSSLPE